MTVENCLKWLEIFKRRIELQGPDYAESKPDGRGRDSAERAAITKQATKALANMKAHILHSVNKKGQSSKWFNHPILEELQAKPKVKKDGKKPKR